MYEQVYDPVGSSLVLTAIFAVLPLLTLFILLGGLKWSAHRSAIRTLAVALVIAIAVYTMPIGEAVNSAVLGAVFGLFPIMWIVWNAIWIYNMTEVSGHFALGKMISPQNLAIGAAAVGLGGREGELFRRVLGWSLILLLVMCVLVYLQSTPVLSWMVV